MTYFEDFLLLDLGDKRPASSIFDSYLSFNESMPEY